MIIWLDPLARWHMERETLRRRFLETGGPLFGFEGVEGIVIVGAGGPGPKARHRPFSFCPDHDAVDRALVRVREASDFRYRYLGSWHTHPFGQAQPSARDVAAARGISEEPEVLLPRPVVLIQATRPLRRTFRDRDLRAYRWMPTADNLAMLELRVIRDSACRYPFIDLDWESVVV